MLEKSVEDLDTVLVQHHRSGQLKGRAGLRLKLYVMRSSEPDRRLNMARAAAHLLDRFSDDYTWRGFAAPYKGWRPRRHRRGDLDLLGLVGDWPRDDAFSAQFGNGHDKGKYANHQDVAGDHMLSFYSAADYQELHGTTGRLEHCLPASWILEHGVEAYRDLVLEVVRLAKPSQGRAGFGAIIAPHDHTVTDTAIKGAFYAPAWVLNGADFCWAADDPVEAPSLATLNWLTVIGEDLLDLLGGIEALPADRAAFPVYPYEGGVTVQAGPEPDAGDAGRWPPYYVALYRHIKPIIRPTLWNPFVFNGDPTRKDDLSALYQRRFDLETAVEAAREAGLLP